MDDESLDEELVLDDTGESGEAPAFVHERREVATSDLPPEPAFATPELAFATPEPASATREPEEEPAAMDATTPHGASWLRAGVRFEVLVLIVFGGIGLFLSNDPDQALQLLPPILRADSTEGVGRHGLQQLHLAELRGVREELRGGRPAFVISGQVINDSSHAIGAVQVEGRLYSESQEISSRTVYAGTKASRQLVRSWTPTEIAMFQKIKPPKTYRLKPGGADNFLIIFQEIPDTLTEFACRVVSALPARRE
jgi:hypothetical protein